MSAPRYVTPYGYAYNSVGQPIPGALLNFYLTGSSTRAPTYSDAALTTPNPNPVPADANGTYPNIFLDPTITYKAVQTYPVAVGAAVIWTADPLSDPLGGSGGAGLVGYNHSTVYLAGSVGERLNRDFYITDEPYGGDHTAGDNRDAVLRMLDAIDSNGSGTGHFPAAPTPYQINSTPGPIQLPAGAKLMGDGYFDGAYGVINAAAASIKNTGTDYVFQFADASVGIEEIGFFGSAGAQGAIRWGTGSSDANQCGRSTLRHCLATGFTANGAAPFWLQSCIRTVMEDIYTISNFTSLIGGANCQVQLINSEISGNDKAGKALDFTVGGPGGVQFHSLDTYYESCQGQYPIDLLNSGQYRFTGRGMEDMCQAGASTITNPAVIRLGGASFLDLDMSNIDFFSTGDNLAGTLSFLYALAGSHFRVKIQDTAMQYTGGGRGGVLYQFFTGIDYGTQGEIDIQRAYGAGFANLQAVRRAFSTLINTLYTPQNIRVEQLQTLDQNTGAVYTDRIQPHMITVPNAANSGNPSGIAYPLVKTGIGSASYTIDTMPIGTLSSTREVVIEIAGFTTGTAGNTSASINIICGSTTTALITSVAAAQRSFKARINLKAIAQQQYELEIEYIDGGTPGFTRQALAINNATTALQISVTVTNVGADTNTISTITLDRH